jgi:replicative DNA helicase
VVAIQRLGQAKRANQAAGREIYCPFDIMNRTETFIRQGQLTMVAAAPGTGKSAVVQAWLQRGNDEGNHNSVLYFSADTDPVTMWVRAAAIVTGYEQSDIMRMIQEGNDAGLIAEVQKAAGHMEFSFNTAPTDEDVMREVEAYCIKWGAYPEVIVMDNLSNLYAGDGSEFEALQGNCDFLHTLARQTNAAVITLHHVTGDYENGDKVIPLGGLRGKLSKTPETIFTLFRRGQQLMVTPVKLRNGSANPSGNIQLPVVVDLGRMDFS